MDSVCVINSHKISKTTQKKMEFILADENQSVTGFVVTNKDGVVTIINQNAVRRFQSHKDYMVMMNPEMNENTKGGFEYQPNPKSNESLLDDFLEINLANYTDDDVRRMNDWAINAYTAMKGGE